LIFFSCIHAVDTRYGEGTASTGHEPHTGADKSPSSRTTKSSAAATTDVASMMQYAYTPWKLGNL